MPDPWHEMRPGFGGQSGEGKAGAAVDLTAMPFIGRIC